MQSNDHKPLDRVAMIEAASRSLRQQMGKGRDRPRSKGSLHEVQAHAAGDASETQTAESAQRRIRSVENDHRVIAQARPEGSRASHSNAVPDPTNDGHFVDEEEDLSLFHKELKRPLSRKKDPSASAAVGLGAFSNPVKMTDAFEQRKTRQPIPVESWGPRPPSRHGLPPKAAPLDSPLGDESKILSSSSRSRGDGSVTGSNAGRLGGGKSDVNQGVGSKVVGGVWATARDLPPRGMSETRRGRDGGRRTSNRGSPEDLGIFCCGTKSPSQQLQKSHSGALDHSAQFAESDGGTRLSPSHDGADSSENNCGFVDSSGVWISSPVGSCASPPTRRGRHSETVSVEDVEPDLDLGMSMSYYRRDATPPQVIVTRSGQNSKNRGDPRRSRDQRTKDRPFGTSLDVDFLSLFAT